MKKIRFIHMADLHIGSSAYIKMEIDELSLIHEIIDNANSNNIDIIMISGDLYDQKPTKKMLDRLNSIFSRFNGKIFIIYGNHDYEVNATNLIYPDNVYTFENTFESFFFEELNLRVWGYSYDGKFIEKDIYKEYFENIELNNNEINVLLAHGGDNLHIPMDYKFLSQIFKYVALGHLHKYQTPEKNVVYSGSLIPNDSTENYIHGYISGEISDFLYYNLISTEKQYTNIVFDITPFSDIEELYISLKSICKNDSKYIVTIEGVRNTHLDYDINHLNSIKQIEKIIDKSVVKYDYESIKMLNKNNILGKFIENMQNSNNPLAELALEYGVRAFLEAKDDEN